MSGNHGKFCWYELMTTDMAAAQSFYGDVIGWKGRDGGHDDFVYTLLGVDGTGVAGVMKLPKEAVDSGVKPSWMGYVAVDDLDESVAKLIALGGRLHRDPQEIPGVGRFAIASDPQGAAFVLFLPNEGSEPPPGPTPDKVGFAGWRELMAVDGEAAFAFYAELFGWTKDQALDMGEMGVYQTFVAQGESTGGVMTKPAGVPAPFWTYYFLVDGIGTAIARIKAAGGTVINGPMEVPGGRWIVQALDPQGAVFALLSPNA
jgi:predicted enzyme related to lactoylglutathione lyase